MNTIQTRPITIEEFENLPYATTERKELVRGEMTEKMSPGADHSGIAARIIFQLMLWAEPDKLGFVGPEAGYILADNPPTLRLADVSFVRADRIPATGRPKGFWRAYPDLAVEVISPSETLSNVRAKVRDYLDAGTPLVWTVLPDTSEVIAYTPDGIARTYRMGETLEFPDVLPGFSCAVDAIFAE